MSTTKRRTLKINLFLLAAALLLSARTTHAAGTPAGTVISSRAMAIYTTASGAQADTIYSAIVRIVVKQVATVNVVLPSLTQTSGDGLNVVYLLSILNSGNGTDKFTVTRSSSKGWPAQMYCDINGNGILDAADSLAGQIASTDSLKADSSCKIIVRVAVPDNEALNAQTDSTILSASSQFDGSKSASSVIRTNIQTAVIDASTSLSVDNPAPIVSAPITFTLVLTNAGLATAANVSVVDNLDPRFAYLSSTNGGVHTSSDSVRWTIPSIAPGGSASMSVTVNLPANLPSGTFVPNAMTVTYNDGILHRSKNSNTVNVGTGSIYGVSILPDSISNSKEPDDSVKYYLTVKNIGNKKDVFEMSAHSSQPLAWTFIKDVNNNRIIDPTDAPLTNTNANAGVDVDSIAAGDSLHLFGLAILPFVQLDQTQDVTTFTATSSASPAKFQSTIASTTTNIPIVDVSISVSPTPSQQQPPGAELTYTISYLNKGHADIDTSFAVAARIPDSTRIVLGSVKLGTLSIPDSAAVNNGFVSVKTGALKHSTSGTVEFKVKIK